MTTADEGRMEGIFNLEHHAGVDVAPHTRSNRGRSAFLLRLRFRNIGFKFVEFAV
jgi:hypothetical protein